MIAWTGYVHVWRWHNDIRDEIVVRHREHLFRSTTELIAALASANAISLWFIAYCQGASKASGVRCVGGSSCEVDASARELCVDRGLLMHGTIPPGNLVSFALENLLERRLVRDLA